MASILSAEAPSPWRVTVVLDSAGSTTPGNYTLARADGVAGAPTATLAFIPGGQPNVIALALSAKLIDGMVYSVAVAGIATPVKLAFRSPVAAAQIGGEEPDDPEAEVYGVDVAWLTDQLGPGGRLPRRRGLSCVKYDLAAIAVERPGERFHRPTEGGGLRGRINGPGAPAELARTAAQVKRQWARDLRVEQGGISVTPSIDSTGLVSLDANVKTIAIGVPVAIRVTGV